MVGHEKSAWSAELSYVINLAFCKYVPPFWPWMMKPWGPDPSLAGLDSWKVLLMSHLLELMSCSRTWSPSWKLFLPSIRCRGVPLSLGLVVELRILMSMSGLVSPLLNLQAHPFAASIGYRIIGADQTAFSQMLHIFPSLISGILSHAP